MEPLFKSIMGWVDYHIDQDPLRKNLTLNENQTISFLASMKSLYEQGRLRHEDDGYYYRGVQLILNEDYRYLVG